MTAKERTFLAGFEDDRRNLVRHGNTQLIKGVNAVSATLAAIFK